MDMWAKSLRGLKKYMEGMDMETEIEKGGVFLRWHSGGKWWCATHGTEKRRSTLSPIAVEAEVVRLPVNRKEMKNLKNCKVIPGSDVINQHNLVVVDMWRGKARKGRFRTWELNKIDKKEDFKTRMKEKFQGRSEGLGVDEM